MPSQAHNKAYLHSLLAQRNQDSALHAQIDDAIEAAFVRQVAILALDMCGFTSTTNRHGIIHFLAMVHQMEQAARPAIEANGGTVIKQEADNLFAVFSEPGRAVEAALDIRRALDAMNAVQPPESALYASIGIGFGPTLVIAESDLFGAEMNFACKLGEDIAAAGEILLTPAAVAKLPPGNYLFGEITPEIGGAAQSAFSLQACVVDRPLGPAVP
ncbi:MAG: adenylate/guanylate cyclase domain-containing protein [Giesbergeria sp.]